MFVKSLVFKPIALSLGVEGSDTIEEMKAKIREREGIPVNRQLLIFAANQIEYR